MDQPHRHHGTGSVGSLAGVFQSLLSWISLIGNGHAARAVRFFRFQSLLSWISLIGVPVVRSRPPRGQRFNPCCRGSASSAWAPWVIAADRAKEFQSLLSWISLIGSRGSAEWRSAQQCFNPCCRGSASSARGRARGGIRGLSCFNPCCRGSASSATYAALLADAEGRKFQSLLSWISLIGSTAERANGSPSMFQSLLSWISLIGCSSPPSHKADRLCFNPCCRGSASSAAVSGLISFPQAVFQSLLSWISLIGAGSLDGHHRTRNVSILVVVDQPHRHDATPESYRGSVLFQSLLSWISLIGFLPPARIEPPLRVSILVVVDQPHRQPLDRVRLAEVFPVSILVVVDQPHRPLRSDEARRCPVTCFNPCCRGSASSAGVPIPALGPALAGFNPCCRGSASSAGGDPGRDRQRFVVSILVVVDQPHRRPGSRRPDGRPGCFNPCCRGSASSACPLRDRALGDGQGFNPFCRGSASSAAGSCATPGP